MSHAPSRCSSAAAIKPGGCGHQPEAVLDGLIETVIDRASEILERKAGDADRVATSRSCLRARPAGQAEKGDAYQQRHSQPRSASGDLISNVRESMVSLERMLLYLSANMQRPAARVRLSGGMADGGARCAIDRGACKLPEQQDRLHPAGDTGPRLDRAEQDHQAVLGHVSVVMMPPTLIASIYGMNFKKWMPELEWEYGYPPRPDHDGRSRRRCRFCISSRRSGFDFSSPCKGEAGWGVATDQDESPALTPLRPSPFRARSVLA